MAGGLLKHLFGRVYAQKYFYAWFREQGEFVCESACRVMTVREKVWYGDDLPLFPCT